MPHLLRQLADGQEVAAGNVVPLFVLDGESDAALDLLDLGKGVSKGAELLDELPFLDRGRGEKVLPVVQGSDQVVVCPLLQLLRRDRAGAAPALHGKAPPGRRPQHSVPPQTTVTFLTPSGTPKVPKILIRSSAVRTAVADFWLYMERTSSSSSGFSPHRAEQTACLKSPASASWRGAEVPVPAHHLAVHDCRASFVADAENVVLPAHGLILPEPPALCKAEKEKGPPFRDSPFSTSCSLSTRAFRPCRPYRPCRRRHRASRLLSSPGCPSRWLPWSGAFPRWRPRSAAPSG